VQLVERHCPQHFCAKAHSLDLAALHSKEATWSTAGSPLLAQHRQVAAPHHWLQELAPNSTAAPPAQLTTLAPLNSAVDGFLAGLDPPSHEALLASPKAIVALLAYHAILPPPLRYQGRVQGLQLEIREGNASGNASAWVPGFG
jgi:hypothetical protein